MAQIEQVKPINLGDVWNPGQMAGLAMQANQLDIQRGRLEMMEGKAEDAELINLLKVADLPPTATYFAAKKLLDKHGFKLDPVDFTKFEPLYKTFTTSALTNGADAPETVAAGNALTEMSSIFRGHVMSVQEQARKSQQVQGMGSIMTRATGNPTSAIEAEAAASSPAIQKELGGAIAQTPLEQEKAKVLKRQAETLKIMEQDTSNQLQTLVQYNKPTFLDLNMESSYLAAKGAAPSKAGSVLGDVRSSDDDLAAQYGTLTKEERTKMVPQVEQQVADLRGQQRTIQAQIQQGYQLDGTERAFDVGPLKDQLLGINSALQVKLAEKDYLKTGSTSNFSRLQQTQGYFDSLIQARKDSIKKLQEQQTGFFNEKGAEFAVNQETLMATNWAKERFMQLPTDQQTFPMAAKIARESGNPRVDPRAVMESVKALNPSLVTINQQQERAEDVKVGTGQGERYNVLQDARLQASTKIAKLQRMDQLLNTITTGKLTPTAKTVSEVAQGLGYDIDPTLPAKQAFEALANEIALELRNPATGAGMPGNFSDQDRAYLQSIAPALSKTNAGNKIIIETAMRIQKRTQEMAKMAADYRRKHRHFDEGFFDAMQVYSDAHPLFADLQTKLETINADAAYEEGKGVAPFPDAEKESRYQEWKKTQQ